MAVPNAETSWWNHRVLSMHKDRLNQIKPTMNIKDESHVRSIDQRKKELIRQQREAKIEQDNKKLVVNMMQIVAKMGKEAAQVAAPFKVQSRAEAQRRRQAQEIARQNYVRVHHVFVCHFAFLVDCSPGTICTHTLVNFPSYFTLSLPSSSRRIFLLNLLSHLFFPFREQTLAMRIINQKPSFDQKKLETDFKKHEQIVRSRDSLIAKYHMRFFSLE